ncbi:hypothetical protein COU54_03760 [Candidatus Pacearchaeota archaeon CG10_big_fil_rev_8_21_14_0_10_31_24]|nr:MAG: hypothetical protein COU54_03760 [Candidatus Pacearchaeota archaeon CG10_big_fil_rev_8_21_14_0_10_31_24]
MKAQVVYTTYDLQDEKTIVQIFGRLENKQSFIAICHLKPYFFIIEKDHSKIKKLLNNFEVEKTNLKTFSGENVIKISSENHIILNKLSSEIHKLEINNYEADIKPNLRFMIDNDLLNNLNIEGNYETSEKVDRIYIDPEIKPSTETQELKVISLDTESDRDGNLFCIGMYGKNYKKNFIISNKTLKNAISCKDEEECLEKFKAEFLKQDPDIVTGWNMIDFDLDYLKEKFKKHKILFDLGRTKNQVRLRIDRGFFKSSSADIEGRQVLDGLNLIKDPFIKEAPTIKNAKFEAYTLEAVSQAILGKGKLLKGKGRHLEIEELYEKNQEKLVDYNLMDCELAYEILEKTDMLNLAIERSELTGLPLDKLGASIAAFDSLYIREARKKGLVSPTTHYSKKEFGITGGYVKSIQAGIYNNVLVLDFKSLYPSLMRTFNIDPASFLEKPQKGAIESPNKAYFKNQEGILPIILEKLHKAREKAKKEKRELASYAIKIIMNSLFGVLASPNSRYFNYNMANSITNFGQMIIKLTAEEIEKTGFKVIYSDTDSVFVETNLSKEKANILGKKIEKEINEFYQKYTREKYSRESFLELEFEKQYISLMIPSVRNKDPEKEKAAKKRYAGLKEKNGKEELEIVGLEAIRGDWTEAAQDFQKELLLKVFHKESPEKFIKEYIKKINEGKLDSKLVYKKSIRKELDEYTKTTPPHVKAARKLDKLDSNVIQYYITMAGPEPIQKLKHKLDYKHYIDKQISPIADQVLNLFGKSMENINSNSKQSTLF